MNVRPLSSPDVALKWKNKNIYFMLGDIFSQVAVAPLHFPALGQLALGLLLLLV